MRLSKFEKENIILISEGDDTVSIYTFNAALKRRLADYAKKYPKCAQRTRWTVKGSVTYVLDKSRVSIRLLPPVNLERRKAASEDAKKYGLNSNNRMVG